MSQLILRPPPRGCYRPHRFPTHFNRPLLAALREMSHLLGYKALATHSVARALSQDDNANKKKSLRCKNLLETVYLSRRRVPSKRDPTCRTRTFIWRVAGIWRHHAPLFCSLVQTGCETLAPPGIRRSNSGIVSRIHRGVALVGNIAAE